ncbi:3'-5' exonuclease [Candidatus Pacearchaeota archaeon]|nr:3'-5' exonuclease [Candidatus Pacearchaeota archaeon]
MGLNLKKPLAFIDIETTGIDILKDKIVEIAILKIMPDGNTSNKVKRVNPTIHIPAEASAIHGIYDKDVEESPLFSQIAQEIIDFIDGCDLAGFNHIRFDIPLLIEECSRAGINLPIEDKKFIDVQIIFHKKEPRDLATAYRFYCNKELNNSHNALTDVIATHDILLAQIQHYNDLGNEIDSLHQLSMDGRVDFAGKMVYGNDGKERFNFGKHKDKLIEEVLRQDDPSYYDWMMNADFSTDTKKKLSNIKEKIKPK